MLGEGPGGHREAPEAAPHPPGTHCHPHPVCPRPRPSDAALGMWRAQRPRATSRPAPSGAAAAEGLILGPSRINTCCQPDQDRCLIKVISPPSDAALIAALAGRREGQAGCPQTAPSSARSDPAQHPGAAATRLGPGLCRARIQEPAQRLRLSSLGSCVASPGERHGHRAGHRARISHGMDSAR